MSEQEAPKSADDGSGFPYQLLWEEFEPDWETFRLDQVNLAFIEGRFQAARIAGAPSHLGIRREDVGAVLEPLALTDQLRQRLTKQLYWLAGSFLSREHGRFFNTGPTQVRRRLETISKEAKALNVALTLMTPEALALLTLFRPAAPHVTHPDKPFALIEMLDLTRDLALTSDFVIADLPTRPRGQTVDMLRDRWIWYSARAIETATGIAIRAPQSDTVGRKARLEGKEGTVLLEYLRLAAPGIRLGTIVRVITERRKAAKPKPAL